MTSFDSLEHLNSFMQITPASEDICFTEGLKKEDSIYDDVVAMEEADMRCDILSAPSFEPELSKIQNLFSQQEINTYLNFMTSYFYQYFNIFEQCMTNNVDINVYSKNFFPKSLAKVIAVKKGVDVNPYEYPVLEDYVPQDNAM
jgi:hypothetical protein